MSKFDSWIDNKVIQNLFIWFCLFLILLVTVQADDKIASAVFVILLLAPAIYINNLLILPFFLKNKWFFWILFLINATVFTSIAVYFIAKSLQEEFTINMFINFFGILILALIFGSAIKISRDSFIRRQEEKNAELKLLKAQLNPHFLFNTLNNLYGLSVVKSDKLPNLMLKLSDLLRYSLYDTKETYVSLEREVQYLENYISLEKIRLEDKAEIILKKKGTFADVEIAPMLLIVFVENAFKHLANATGEKESVIINIETTDNTLVFTCMNSIDKESKKSTIETGKSGIGLNNAKKRLALLYPDKHTLLIESSDYQFSVDLTLNF